MITYRKYRCLSKTVARLTSMEEAGVAPKKRPKYIEHHCDDLGDDLTPLGAPDASLLGWETEVVAYEYTRTEQELLVNG